MFLFWTIVAKEFLRHLFSKKSNLVGIFKYFNDFSFVRRYLHDRNLSVSICPIEYIRLDLLFDITSKLDCRFFFKSSNNSVRTILVFKLFHTGRSSSIVFSSTNGRLDSVFYSNRFPWPVIRHFFLIVKPVSPDRARRYIFYGVCPYYTMCT